MGNDLEDELIKLKEKNQDLQNLYQLEIKGYIIRSKAEYIEGGEKNTKYLANLEKQRSDAKTLHKFKSDMVEITDRKEILNEVRSLYEKKNMYTEQIVDEDKMNQMINNSSVKLNAEEKKNYTEGPLTEYECTRALRNMNNNKSPGSVGVTTEFYKIFWNDI